jgi:uncharacterized protein (TIGR02466 family)
MQNIRDIFSIPIYNSFINIDTDKLIDMAYEERKLNSKGRSISNQGGYQTNDLDYNKYKFLFDQLHPHIVEYYNLFGFKNAELFLANFWTNISNYRDFNKPHVHAGSTISGVIYLKSPQTPKCGNIIFEHPYSGIDFFTNGAEMNDSKYNHPCYFFNCEPKLLLLFPSYLRHYVQPNKTKEDRISMSFNFGTRW